ncbi:MAG: ATPase [marine bacterium B5-7]|nr:MAG: ATPase [marine bacterium B5-7]
MQRHFIQKLHAWKSHPRRKPLIVQGARQVGKTYIIKQFGQDAFANTAYFNFEEMPDLHSLFTDTLSAKPLLERLSLYKKMPLTDNTLIIFDEIQACSNALNSLKYFCEDMPNIPIIAAGSLLGIKLAQTTGFPVGKVHFETLYPMTFSEFLLASGEAPLNEWLESIDEIKPLPEAFHQQLLQHLKTYLLVGGMPEAVQTYQETRDFYQVIETHQDILKAYLLDFSKHAEANQIMKISTVWDQLPEQLAKENKKFIFSAISQSARAREYEVAIQWLVDANLVLKTVNVNTPKHPLKHYANKSFFKLYLLDVGLLSTLCDVDPTVFLQDQRLFTEYHGALVENYVAQALCANHSPALHYWTSQGRAEVDFIVQYKDSILPLEVKAGTNTQHRSLRTYHDKYQPSITTRVTALNLKRDDYITNLPLYMVSRFPTWLVKSRENR